MNLHKFLKVLIIAMVVVFLMNSHGTAQANTRTTGEGEVPFYARVEISDGSLYAVVFYRPAECIPPAFNLLDFYDPENCWTCGPTTTEGFMLWENGPEVDDGPVLSVLKGRGAVPVWFASVPELEGAAADGILTIGELGSLPSLQKGFASDYQETLRPYPIAVTNTMVVEARGSLLDGRAFKVHFNHTEANYNAKISISP